MLQKVGAKKLQMEQDDILQTYAKVRSGALKRFPNGTWSPENGGRESFRRCVREYFLNILNWSREDVVKNVTQATFRHGKLYGGLNLLYGSSPSSALKSIFPEWEIKEWELVRVPQSKYWNKETILKATRWLFEVKLNLSSREEIIMNASRETFIENNLYKAYQAFHKKIDLDNSRLFELISLSFQEYNFQIYEFSDIRNRTEQDIVKSVKWLVEEKYGWSLDDTAENIKTSHFKENGLYGMLKTFRNSPYQILCFVYPEHDWSTVRHRKDLND